MCKLGKITKLKSLLVMVLLCIFSQLNFAHANTTYNFRETVTISGSVQGHVDGVQQPAYIHSDDFDIYEPEAAQIEFLTYSPLGTSTGNVLNGSDISVSSDASDGFQPVDTAILTDAGIDTTEEIPLVPINFIKDGQTLFVRINDALQNTNSSAIDTVDVTIDILRGAQTASIGTLLLTLTDAKVLKLYETGPNTGIFIGYIPFSATDSQGQTTDSPIVVAEENSVLSAVYEQSLITTVAVDVDVTPEGRVFNSLTGAFMLRS